jgi:hypothetical protein
LAWAVESKTTVVKHGLSAMQLTILPSAVCASLARGTEAPGDTQTLPCRPTIACTADIVPPGAFELETGVLFRLFDKLRGVSNRFAHKP